MTNDAPAVDTADYMDWDSIERASEAWWAAGGANGTAYDEFRGKYLPLPSWYDSSLDPLSTEYRAQQDRLWQTMVGDGRLYDPASDEQSGVDESIALLRPGLYSDTLDRAGDHLIAMGHVLKHSKLEPGDRVLEYGAGYGQIALALARMGMRVDTVDVDPGFCSAVKKQADWFQVDLNPHRGLFGDNPSGERYAMILFYEAFHHARNFAELIPRFRELLLPGGRIVMAGEPIVPKSDRNFAKSCPYPWGIRLEAEVAAIVRRRGWYELGFREEFIFDLFDSWGFTPSKTHGQISHYATVHTFELRPDLIRLADWRSSQEVEEGWHGPEPEGRWTKSCANFPTERTPDWTSVRIRCVNHHPTPQTAVFELGPIRESISFLPGEERDVSLARHNGSWIFKIICDAIQPSSYGIPDERQLGLFVKEVELIGRSPVTS